MVHNNIVSKVKTYKREHQINSIVLSSTKSTIISLHAIRNGDAGLNSHRQSLLNRVLNRGEWAYFKRGSIEMKDLAYLTAKTGDEFALLRGKKADILFHGDSKRCKFDDRLGNQLITHKLSLIGHSHPGEPIPRPSNEDRQALKKIGQSKSAIISAMTGICLEFSEHSFEI